jgi:hypothetical protein
MTKLFLALESSTHTCGYLASLGGFGGGFQPSSKRKEKIPKQVLKVVPLWLDRLSLNLRLLDRRSLRWKLGRQILRRPKLVPQGRRIKLFRKRLLSWILELWRHQFG